MRMFDSVVVACDQGSLDVALAVRGALELFRLTVHLYFCVQKRNVLDLLGGKIPDADHVVLCSHGLGSEGSPDESGAEMRMGFLVVDEVDGKWQKVEVALTPGNIPDLVRLPGRTVVSLGCASGREPIAKAFLQCGCRGYAGPVLPVNQDSTALFAIAFFYYLLSSDRDASLKCGEAEAAQRAGALDTGFREGTGSFRYYARE